MLASCPPFNIVFYKIRCIEGGSSLRRSVGYMADQGDAGRERPNVGTSHNRATWTPDFIDTLCSVVGSTPAVSHDQ
jgi:hypothetical protein